MGGRWILVCVTLKHHGITSNDTLLMMMMAPVAPALETSPRPGGRVFSMDILLQQFKGFRFIKQSEFSSPSYHTDVISVRQEDGGTCWQ